MVSGPGDRERPCSPEHRSPLEGRWQMLAMAPGAAETPAALRAALAATGANWVDISGPGTVAASLRALGQWSLDGPARRFDADDWWFRASFDAPAPLAAGNRRELEFGGLAGLCQVWLDDEPLLASDNMHRRHRCAVPAGRAAGHELLMRFASLDRFLAGTRRPRPRWRTPMVEHQQLRWARQTLLGRTPGWSPPAAPVGPWRGIHWVEQRGVTIERLRLQTGLDGSTGQVRIAVDLAAIDGTAPVETVQLVLERDGQEHRQSLARQSGTAPTFAGALAVPDAARWWPHTHGEPALYTARLEIRLGKARSPIVAPLHRLGFRALTVDTANGNFAIRVDGVPIFCRGACWTPLDVVALRATPEATRAALEQVKRAGMNMLRLSGTMVAEEAHFFDACDDLGILVWQDLMFASMDYPAEDPAFAATVREEVGQQLGDWQARASLAVICGNSEAEQQAAMWGAPREQWSQPLFARDLAKLVRAACPGVHYWPSSAHGGALPQQPNAGTTSYYGVGAYLRPLDDARRSGLRFATECLAFANVPPAATLARIPGGAGHLAHHAGWKTRSPRDLGAGWDFDDVRDHYLQHLYGVAPALLRASDNERYLALSRAVSGEVMQASMAEWRRGESRCGGALVWFLRDLWAGAGWGLLDERGHPKAAFHGLKRACAPRALFITDEGMNGLSLHLVNDTPQALMARLEVALYRDDGQPMTQPVQEHPVAGHSVTAWPVADWFDHFVDLSRAYRFGPAEHALVVATLRTSDAAPGSAPLAQAFHFLQGLPSSSVSDIGLTARAQLQGDGTAELLIETRGFAQSVQVDAPGWVADDEFFHIAPGGRQRLRLMPSSLPGRRHSPRGSVTALNSRSTASFEITP